MKLLYVSLIDWYFTKQRPHHLVINLSNYHQIVFCSARHNQKRQTNKHNDSDKFSKNISINLNLEIFRFFLLPFTRFKIVNQINNIITRIKYNRLVINYKPDLIILSHPEQYRYFINSLVPIAYDCMDNYIEFKKNNDEKVKLYELENLLLKKSLFNFVSSNGLYAKIHRRAIGETIVVNNATEFSIFGNPKAIESDCPLELINMCNIVGYFGGISSWFNTELLEHLASKRPDFNYVIIGPQNNENLIASSKKYSNIHLIGPRTYNDLPKYLNKFRVCIMPFVLSELILDVNPVKIYEYLSMGKPVVAPFYEELTIFGDLIYLSNNDDDFLHKIELAMNENNDVLREKRIEFARNNTWENRADQLNSMIITFLNTKD